ncbi:MAG: hypothetical protein AAF432_08790 [Planctomycetota bacterium]
MSRALRIVTFICLVSLTAIIAGCGESAETDARIGSWKLDAETMKKDLEAKDDGSGMEGFALAMISSMQFQLDTHADGTFTINANFMGEAETIGGTWTRTEDGMLMTNTTKNGEPDESGETAEVKLIDDDHMKLVQSNGDMEMKFVRIVVVE